MSFDFKSIIATVAPVIAGSFGTPLAGMAVKAGLSALGIEVDPGNEEQQFADAMQHATPEDLLKLKLADQDFAVQMKKLNVDLVKLGNDDRNSARKMQASNKSIIVPILAGLTVAGFFATMTFVLMGKVSLDSTVLGFVLGQISSKTEQVYNYFFGSSSGSKEKTDALANIGSKK
jgi:hypothetical protein